MAFLGGALLGGVIIGVMVGAERVTEGDARVACQKQGFSTGHYDATYGFVCERWEPMPTPTWEK